MHILKLETIYAIKTLIKKLNEGGNIPITSTATTVADEPEEEAPEFHMGGEEPGAGEEGSQS